ncbi:MAG: MlaD family protein [Bacteriovoracia bacterium]
MNRSLEIEVKVGLFVVLGLLLTMGTVLTLGGGKSLFSRDLTFKARFSQIEGLVAGANVKIAGIRVGQVAKINYDSSDGSVEVYFSVGTDYKDAIHQDSIVGIATQGVLGDRFLVLSGGTPSAPVMADGAELKSEEPKDFKDYLSGADALLISLKNTAVNLEHILAAFNRDNRPEVFFKNMSSFSISLNKTAQEMSNIKKSIDNLASITAKIDRGQGTIGALINDPSLYDDLKNLVGGANRNRVLKYFIKKSVESSKEADSD